MKKTADWLNRKAAPLVALALLVGAILTLAAYWKQFDLPVPATVKNVTDVEVKVETRFASSDRFARGTRVIILQQQRRELRTELERVRGKLSQRPRDARLQRDKVDLEEELAEINRQLDMLR